MDPYRSENETLRAKLAMAEEEAHEAVTTLQRTSQAFEEYARYRGFTTWSLAGALMIGIAIGTMVLGFIVEWRDARAENPPAPSALVLRPLLALPPPPVWAYDGVGRRA